MNNYKDNYMIQNLNGAIGILYYYIHFTMQNFHLPEFLADSFRCHVHSYQYLAVSMEFHKDRQGLMMVQMVPESFC